MSTSFAPKGLHELALGLHNCQLFLVDLSVRPCYQASHNERELAPTRFKPRRVKVGGEGPRSTVLLPKCNQGIDNPNARSLLNPYEDLRQPGQPTARTLHPGAGAGTRVSRGSAALSAGLDRWRRRLGARGLAAEPTPDRAAERGAYVHQDLTGGPARSEGEDGAILALYRIDTGVAATSVFLHSPADHRAAAARAIDGADVVCRLRENQRREGIGKPVAGAVPGGPILLASAWRWRPRTFT